MTRAARRTPSSLMATAMMRVVLREERAAYLIVYRLEQLHEGLRQTDRRPRGDEAFRSTMVMWDFHARQPKKIFEVPGAPLEIRWAWGDKHNYASLLQR